MTRWGIVSTVKAPAERILEFAAYHIELGAHRLYLYLDAPEPVLFDRLRAHPRVEVVACDTQWWANRKGRPHKHQTRQFVNARHAYRRRVELDWLAHIDVDEFLWSGHSIGAQLDTLPDDCLCARVRPIEALVPPPGEPGASHWFKAFHLDHAKRRIAAQRCHPTYGRYLSGGFLSHVAGKLFYRTGVEGLQARIHNIEVNGERNPGEAALAGVELCHRHATGWEDWLEHYRYRLERGSYRAELKPSVRRDAGGLTTHELLRTIEETDGTAGLRAFFDEICVATPALRDALASEGLLRRCDLRLSELRARHFPGA